MKPDVSFAADRSRLRRRLATVLVALTLVFSTGCDPYTDWQDKARHLINNSRDNHSRRRLPMNLAAANKAQRWANHLAQCRCLRHSNLAAGMPSGWRAIAENVGRGAPGGNLASIHRQFLSSSGHRANVLDRRWTVVGTGVAARGRTKYVVQVFAQY